MKATQKLQELGQSLWLDNITRGILNDGTLAGYIRDLSVTGLTSNPTIFDHAMTSGDFYDGAIQQKAAAGKEGEALFFELAIEDLCRAADLFRLVHDATKGVDGLVSLEVSPQLANDTVGTIAAAVDRHRRAARPNAPDTVNTIPEKTLKALADHGRVGETLVADGGNCERVLANFERAGINEAALAAQLQREGAESFDKSWTDLLDRLAAKRAALATNAHTDAHTA